MFSSFNQENMRALQLLLYVLICCQAAVSDLQTDLGSNVTINCDHDGNEVYWVLQKTPDPPTLIVRTDSPPASPHYFNKTFRSKYSVHFKHRLVINNITADELGVYYCMTTDAEPKFSNSSRIYIIEPTQPTVNCTEPQNLSKWQIISITSGLLNGLLIIVVIGLLRFFAVRKQRSLESIRQLHNTDLQQTQQSQDPDQLQYAEVDFSKLRKNIRSSQVNSTYAALNLPKP